MANKKSSKKDIRRIAKRTVRNKETKSALKTYIKKVRQASATHEPEAIGATLVTAMSKLDKASQRGVIHPNQAARRKSRIAKQAAAALKIAPEAPKEPKAPKAEKAPAKKTEAKAAPAKAPKAEKPAAEKKPAAPKKAAKKTEE